MTHSETPIDPTDPRPLALVTGATGLLGSNLVRALVAQGTRVRALVRSREKAEKYLAGLDIELRVGDLARVDALASTMTGCDRVFHTAAYFREYYQPGDHDAQLERINIEATLKLMEYADAAGVDCFVHTSSSGTIGMKPDGSPGDEDTPAGATQLKNRYFRSKFEGDRRIAAFTPQHGMRVVEILPGWMWGPGDAAPTAAGQFALDFVRRKIPVVPDGGANLVDARDVAQAMIRAAEHAAHGGRYIVAGPFVSLEELLQELERITQVKAPTLKVPFALALAFACFEELRVRMTGAELLVSREGLRIMRAQNHVSSARAERELAATFRPLRATLHDTLAWYQTHARLPHAALQPTQCA